MSERTRWYAPIGRAIDQFIENDALAYAAALAFYTALGFAPLLIILVACLSLFLGDTAQVTLVENVREIAGPSAARVAKQVLSSGAARPQLSSWAGWLGAGTLLVSATGVFAQLQSFLNITWQVKPKPGLEGVWVWLRKRLLSAGMIIAIGFLLLVSLAFSTGLQLFLRWLGAADAPSWLWFAADGMTSLLVFFVVFAAMFRFLPDVDVEWTDVWRGALATTALFALGRWIVSQYLGVTSVASAYGAAGSLVMLLIWVYYSAIIVFFGAQLTEASAWRRGYTAQPESHATWDVQTPPEEDDPLIGPIAGASPDPFDAGPIDRRPGRPASPGAPWTPAPDR